MYGHCVLLKCLLVCDSAVMNESICNKYKIKPKLKCKQWRSQASFDVDARVDRGFGGLMSPMGPWLSPGEDPEGDGPDSY